MKKNWLWIVIYILILLGVWFIGSGGKFGAVMLESYVFQNQDANWTSVSYDGEFDIISTDAAHGLAVNDPIYFRVASTTFGGDTAPGWTEGTTYWVVKATNSYDFVISSTRGGATFDVGTGASAGGGEFVYELMQGRVFPVDQARYLTFTVCGDATASGAVRFAGSVQADQPNFLNGKGVGNRFDYLDSYDLQSASSIDGDTGILQNSSADCRLYQVFANNLKWATAVFSEFQEGNFDVELQLGN